MATVSCAFCGTEVELRYALRKVTGWEAKRKQGGTNAIVARKPLDEFAHAVCVEKAHNHAQGEQEGLFA